jgi:hypothetical protein
MTPSKLLPPLSNLQGATATKPEELQNVFLRLARTLEGHAPEGDFSEFVRTVEAFQETSDKLVAAENRALTSEVSGLRDYELATLSAMADIVDAPYSQISASEIRARMSESFYAPRATVLGLAGLSRRALVAEVDRNRDERYDRDIALYFITATGWQFLIDNADKLELKVQPSPSSGRRTPATPPPGDDIPF